MTEIIDEKSYIQYTKQILDGTNEDVKKFDNSFQNIIRLFLK